AYFFASSAQPHFFDLNSIGRPWNDNVIWVKGDCLLRDDEEPIELLFRTINQSKYNNVQCMRLIVEIV
ncbi:hypothetical protein GIB67_009943, partial [Kingdonia uniflora]